MATCPKCGRDDQVFKVSGLYESGTTQSQISGGGIAFSDDGIAPVAIGGTRFSQTVLAKRLAPPKKLERKDMPVTYNDRLMIVVCVFVGAVFLMSVLIQDALGGIMLCVILAISPVLLLIAASRNRKDRIDTYSRYEPKYQLELEEWNRSYYCYRDDLVFVHRNTFESVSDIEGGSDQDITFFEIPQQK